MTEPCPGCAEPCGQCSTEPEPVPDVAGKDITAEVAERADEIVAEEGLPQTPWEAEGREPTLEEKVDVLAGIIEYQDEQILEIKTACARMAQVVIRLMQAVDSAVDDQSGIIGPDGQRLSRKQRRDIQFGRVGG